MAESSLNDPSRVEAWNVVANIIHSDHSDVATKGEEDFHKHGTFDLVHCTVHLIKCFVVRISYAIILHFI